MRSAPCRGVRCAIGRDGTNAQRRTTWIGKTGFYRWVYSCAMSKTKQDQDNEVRKFLGVLVTMMIAGLCLLSMWFSDPSKERRDAPAPRTERRLASAEVPASVAPDAAAQGGGAADVVAQRVRLADELTEDAPLATRLGIYSFRVLSRDPNSLESGVLDSAGRGCSRSALAELARARGEELRRAGFHTVRCLPPGGGADGWIRRAL